MAGRRFPLVGKALALAGVLLSLSLALRTVGGIVAEREGRLREAERSVAASLASAQTLVGPLLQRDCTESWETTQGEGTPSSPNRSPARSGRCAPRSASSSSAPATSPSRRSATAPGSS